MRTESITNRALQLFHTKTVAYEKFPGAQSLHVSSLDCRSHGGHTGPGWQRADNSYPVNKSLSNGRTEIIQCIILVNRTLDTVFHQIKLSASKVCRIT